MPYKLLKRQNQYCVKGPNVDKCYTNRGDALAYLTALRLNVSEAKSFKPPKGVQKAAQQALDVRKEKPDSQKGMTSVGMSIARDLANGKPFSLQRIKKMYSTLSRHAVNKSADTWDDKGKGWQTYKGWGGDAGLRWAKKILRQEGELDD